MSQLVGVIGYYEPDPLGTNFVHGFHEVRANALDPIYVSQLEIDEQLSEIQKIKENRPYDDENPGDKMAGSGQVENYKGMGLHLAGYGVSLAGAGLHRAGEGYMKTFHGQGLSGLGAFSECSPQDQNEGSGLINVAEDVAATALENKRVQNKIIKPMRRKVRKVMKYPMKNEAKLKRLKPILPGQRLRRALIGKGKKGTQRIAESQLGNKLDRKAKTANRKQVINLIKRLKKM